jgi:hypothetical protein
MPTRARTPPVVLPSNAELRKYLYVRRTADPCVDQAHADGGDVLRAACPLS